MEIIGKILLLGLEVYTWIIILSVAVSWLIAFGVLNTRSEQAANLVRLMEKLTEPVYRPIRRFIPSIGGIDITPMLVIFGIILIRGLVVQLFFGI